MCIALPTQMHLAWGIHYFLLANWIAILEQSQEILANFPSNKKATSFGCLMMVATTIAFRTNI